MNKASAFNPLCGNPLKTRDDIQRAMSALFAPLEPHYSPSGARVSIDGSGAIFDRAAVELEGFARPLWGLAAAEAGGFSSDFWAVVRRGLAAGTDRAHPDYWGDVADVDQRMVELAAIGFALCTARAAFWDPLEERAKLAVGDYLAAARARAFSNNNWKFFRVMIDLGLRAIGRIENPAPVEAYLEEIEGFVLEDGWYRDGDTGQIDHYIGFAFHFYGLIYAQLARDPVRSERLRQRARIFARQYQHWFADDGAALPFGRSLTYRFAAAAFWGACAFAGEAVLPWGQIKGLYLRHLRWWSRQPISRRDGLLTVGYAYPNSLIAEDYSSSCSPYWAFKAFLPLALPASHPFWASDETEIERLTAPIPLRAPGMIIRHMRGQTIALSSGQSNPQIRNGAEKYAKFAYSSRHAFCIEPARYGIERSAFDNMIALHDPDRGDTRVREACTHAALVGDRLVAQWAPWTDVLVTTTLFWDGDWHVRHHEITTPRPLMTIEGGFALPAGGVTSELADHGALAIAGEDASAIVDTSAKPRQARIHRCEPNSNLLYPQSLVPQLAGAIKAGRTTLCSHILAVGDAAYARRSWAEKLARIA